MTLIHRADQADKANIATRQLRVLLDARMPDDVDPARRAEFAQIAGDAASEDRGLAAIDMTAQVAPLWLANKAGRQIKYRVIRAEVRRRQDLGERAADELVAPDQLITVYRLLGPRGGVSTLIENIRRAGADDIPLAYHLKDRTWHRVDRDAGTYTKIA